ncbi:MAG: hypothetical protein ABR613_00585 [Actinomycetota bacterium]
MAIKGKKKSQSRGSQGQRRPAAAPRPVYTGRKHTPWYKTMEGRLVGGMILAVVVGVAIWAIADAQNKSKERTQQREALEGYVSSIRTFATTVGPVAEEIGGVTADEPNYEQLAKDAGEWTADLTAAQAQAATLRPPEGAGLANDLFLQSLASYTAAARTFESVGRAEGNLLTELLAQAIEEREQAVTLFALGVDALDEALVDVGGELSNLTLPQGTPPAAPSPGGGVNEDTQTLEIPPEPEGGGGGGGKKGGGDKGDGN